MADDSPGKVQALRAIFSEKNNPVMGIMPPGGKFPNKPWKNSIESNDETTVTTLKERTITEQKFSQQMTKPVRKPELNGDSHKDLNGFTEKAPKPCVGPKPSYLSQQVKASQETSCDTKNDDIRTRNCDGHALLKSQAKTKAVAETIASFMFTNGFHQKSSSTNGFHQMPPSTQVVGDEKNKNCKVPPPVPIPRNSQAQHELQTELLNLCNSQNSEKLCKSEAEALIINSDNYICKSNCNFRRKELPSLETLGAPPLKPTRPVHVVLPEKYRQTKPSKISNTSSQPPLTAPPAIPQRPAPQRPSYPCPPRPHTPPPLPPVSRTSLSLREEIEELYEDTVLEEHKRPVSLIPEYTAEEEAAEELYNDAEPSEESLLSPPPLKPREPPPPCPSEYLQPKIHNSTEELYQDADEVNNDDEFYEVMPCDMFSEDPGSPVYSNNKKEIERLRREEEKKQRKEQKEREKRDKEMEKLKRKFGLTGDEVPIDDGLVKLDSRGSRGGDLPVKRGETVLILRMEGNPQGRWLVKNEKGKIGYVELTNIEVDPQSVKSVMTIRRYSVISTSEELYSEARSEQEEGIYEVTY